jgi:hypothetical protein
MAGNDESSQIIQPRNGARAVNYTKQLDKSVLIEGVRRDRRFRVAKTSLIGLRNVLFEARSAFTRVTARILALSPYFVTSQPEGLRHLVTSILLRLVPAAAVAGWASNPLDSAAFSRRTPIADNIGKQRDLDYWF